MEKITGGLSNELFKYKNLIFKFYNHSLLELDYSFEEKIQKKLYEKYANVPKIYQSIIVDDKLIGRIEKYIESVPITKEQFTSNYYVCANLLKSIHSTDIKSLGDSCPNFFIYLDNWMRVLDEKMSDDCLSDSLSEFKIIRHKANDYISQLLLFTSHMGFELSLCHNDFQQLNILADSANNYYLIDWEYSSLNYIYYDIANYFAECAFDNKELKYDKSQYPSKESRCQFYKEYFSNEYTEDYYLNFDFLVRNFVPLVEYGWYVWALVKYLDTKSIDYLTYSKIRLENFNDYIENSN